MGTDKQTAQTLYERSHLVGNPAICIFSFWLAIIYVWLCSVYMFQTRLIMASIMLKGELQNFHKVKMETTPAPVACNRSDVYPANHWAGNRTHSATTNAFDISTLLIIIVTFLHGNILLMETLWTQVFSIEKLLSKVPWTKCEIS